MNRKSIGYLSLLPLENYSQRPTAFQPSAREKGLIANFFILSHGPSGSRDFLMRLIQLIQCGCTRDTGNGERDNAS